MKKVIRRFKAIYIDVIVYSMNECKEYRDDSFNYSIEKTQENGKIRFSVKENNLIVHSSFLYKSVFLLKLFNKKGPVIGDCYTKKKYRGRSIYPYMINKIAVDSLKQGISEVFIIVDRENTSSIKGIEKAGFLKFGTFTGIRWLWFYPKKKITYY